MPAKKKKHDIPEKHARAKTGAKGGRKDQTAAKAAKSSDKTPKQKKMTAKGCSSAPVKRAVPKKQPAEKTRFPIVDISASAGGLEVLEASRNEYLELYESAPVAFVTLGRKGIIEKANRHALELMNAADRPVIGMGFSNFVLADDRPLYFRGLKRTTDGKVDRHIDLRLAGPENQPIYVHIIAAPKFDTAGRFSYWHLAFFDVTAQRLNEVKLKEVYEQLGMAASAAELGIWNYDLVSGTTRWNAQLYRLLGLEPRKGPEDSRRFFECIHPEDRQGTLAGIEAVMNKKENEINEEFRIVRPDGKIRWLASRGRIYRDAHGRPVRISGINYDITERKRSEEAIRVAQLQMARQLSETERINEELSQYAYAVSHDLKGPLRALRNYADFLYEDLAGTLTGEQKEYLEGMRAAVQQGDALINDLLSFSRIGRVEPEPEAADAPDVVEEVRAILEPASDVQISVDDQWPEFHADRTLLKQILLNLIANGIKFNRSKKKLIEVGWQAAPGDCIDIFVRDNGIGIDPKYHEQIFRIFQRLHTARHYEGTGIGLAIVHKAANKLGGSVRLESEPGTGSTFYVRLPQQMGE